MTTSSSAVGTGVTALPVSRSVALVALDQQHLLVVDGLHVAVEKRLQQRERSRVAADRPARAIALTFASPSPSASVANRIGGDRRQSPSTRPRATSTIRARNAQRRYGIAITWAALSEKSCYGYNGTQGKGDSG